MSEYDTDSLMKSYFPITHSTDGRLPRILDVPSNDEIADRLSVIADDKR